MEHSKISADAVDLYRKAEAIVALQPAATEALLQDLDAKRLLHELQVHQIELEMQNTELQQSTHALELLLTTEQDLKQQLVHSFDDLEILTAELNLSEERERRRIALALHDQVVQSLAIGKLKLDAALRNGEIVDHPVLQELQSILKTSMLDLRDLSADLSPPILYDLGLRAAIAGLGENLQKKSGFRFTLHSDCPLEAILSEELTVSVFQFCRELLTNIVKHAGATTVTVFLHQKGNRLILNIADDGIGFDPSNYQEGFGLANIRQRVKYLRGEFKVESRSGNGTRSEISIDTRYSKTTKSERLDDRKRTFS